MNKAVFLDRDGVINEDGNYIFTPDNFHFFDDIFGFCRSAKEKGYFLIIVTNQSGIARGYYTEDDFLKLNDWMCNEFKKRGVLIDKVYYCPYHPEKGVGKYKVDSFNRKPNPGMLLQAGKEFSINMCDSLMVGDRDSDMEAGRRAGIGKLILRRGIYAFTASDDVIVVDNLAEAEAFLKS